MKFKSQDKQIELINNASIILFGKRRETDSNHSITIFC